MGGFESLIVTRLRSHKPLQRMYLPWRSVPLAQLTGLNFDDPRCPSDGARVDWLQHAVMITPPGDLHSHHNDGEDLALFLIVQDGGLHYHCRTMGFSYK